MNKRKYSKIDLLINILPHSLIVLLLLVVPVIFYCFLINVSYRYDIYSEKIQIISNIETLSITGIVSMVYFLLLFGFMGSKIVSTVKDTFTLKYKTVKGKLTKELISVAAIRHYQNVPYVKIKNELVEVSLETFNKLKDGDMCEIDCFMYSNRLILLLKY
jgi:hypothetical protein